MHNLTAINEFSKWLCCHLFYTWFISFCDFIIIDSPSLSSECAFCALITFDSATSTTFIRYKSLFHIDANSYGCFGRPFSKPNFVCSKSNICAQLSGMDRNIWRYNLARCEKLDRNMGVEWEIISAKRNGKSNWKQRLIHSHINAHHLPNEMRPHCIFSLVRYEPCFNSIKMQFNWHPNEVSRTQK